MKEEQFIKIPSQGNIYSTTRLGNLILLGSGKHGKVFAYTNPKELEQVPLSDIPSSGVSIEGLYAMNDGTFSSLGVSFVHTTFNGIEETKTPYFNIYSGKWNETSHLEKIGNRKCSKFKLNYFPYHITSATVTKADNTEESVFLLSGSDLKIHTFAESEDGERFIEVPTKDYFPELSGTFPTIVTQIQLLCITAMKKRITIAGCENGTLLGFIVNDTSEVRANSPTPSMDSISSDISKKDMESSFSEKDQSDKDNGESVRIASSKNLNFNFGDSVYRYTAHFDGMINAVRFYREGFSLNAVVASANSPTYVYTDILEDKFGAGRALKFSSRWDAVESICVDDIDSDGTPEIIIGTFGCTMLVYKFVAEIKQWVIVQHQKFPSGILTIDYFNGTLYAVSTSGLHIVEFREAEPHFKEISMSLSNASSNNEPELTVV